MKTITDWVNDVNGQAVAKGWWENERNVGELLMLVTSELAEAFEEYRNGHPLDEVYYPTATSGYIDPDSGQFVHWGDSNSRPSFKPEGFGVEIADAVIRLFDLAGGLGLDLEALVEEKFTYNQGREYRHGGKLA